MSGLKLAAAKARTYPASEFSYTGFSSAGVCAVSQVVKTAQSRGRTERTLLFAAPSRGAPRRAADRRMLRTGLTRHF